MCWFHVLYHRHRLFHRKQRVSMRHFEKSTIKFNHQHPFFSRNSSSNTSKFRFSSSFSCFFQSSSVNRAISVVWLLIIGWLWRRSSDWKSPRTSTKTNGRTTSIDYGKFSLEFFSWSSVFFFGLVNSRTTGLPTKVYIWTDIWLWFDHIWSRWIDQREWSTIENDSTFTNAN